MAKLTTLLAMFVFVCSSFSAVAQTPQGAGARTFAFVEIDPVEISRLQLELVHERLIRIVEPVIYPMQRLQGDHSDWREFYESCGFDQSDASIKTEMGQAWIRCLGDPAFMVFYEGPNPPEQVYGNRTIQVTVQGFDSKESLCIVYDHKEFEKGNYKPKFGNLSDLRTLCTDKNADGPFVRASVVARFNIITKFTRYTQGEANKENEAIKKLFGPNSARSRVITVRDVKSREVTISPVTYEFPKKQ